MLRAVSVCAVLWGVWLCLKQCHGPDSQSAQTAVTPSLHWQPGHHSSASSSVLHTTAPAWQGRHCPVPSSCHKQVIILTEHKCFCFLGGSKYGLVPYSSPWRSSHSHSISHPSSRHPISPSSPAAQREAHQWYTLEKPGNLPEQAPAVPTTFCEFTSVILSHHTFLIFNFRSS